MQSDDKKDTASRKSRFVIAQPASEKGKPATDQEVVAFGWMDSHNRACFKVKPRHRRQAKRHRQN